MAIAAGVSAETFVNQSKATLTIYLNKVLTSGGLDFALTGQSWGESTVTYNSFNLGLIGAPFASNVPVSMAGQFVTIDVTSQVQAWLSGAVTNHGIIIKPAAAPTTSVLLDSKESTTTSHPASLDVWSFPSDRPGRLVRAALPGRAGRAVPRGQRRIGCGRRVRCGRSGGCDRSHGSGRSQRVGRSQRRDRQYRCDRRQGPSGTDGCNGADWPDGLCRRNRAFRRGGQHGFEWDRSAFERPG